MKRLDTHHAFRVHNDWARDKLLSLAKDLSGEALDRAFEMGWGSLRGTLQHLWAAERVWLDRWLGRPQPAYPDLEPGLAIGELQERWRRTANERDEFLERVGPEGYARAVTFTDRQGRTRRHALGDLLLHACNHAMHHRGQALNMLRHVGAETPGLDYLFIRVDPLITQPPVPDFDTNVIRRYYAYSDWAQDGIQAVAARLSDEQLDQRFEIGHGSVRITLLHICDAERWWFDNWTGEPAKQFEELPPTTSMAELRDLFQQTAQDRNAFLGKTAGAALQENVSAWVAPERKLTFALGETTLQLHNHGTHHRAQVRNMLRCLGVETPALDYLAWLKEAAGSGKDENPDAGG